MGQGTSEKEVHTERKREADTGHTAANVDTRTGQVSHTKYKSKKVNKLYGKYQHTTH